MLSEEKTNENAELNPERVPRPEEVLEHQEDLTEEQRLRPLRCRAGSETDSPCPRDATTWMYPKDRDYPLCEEHAHANELWLESSDQGISEEITRDWLRMARAWGFGGLEQLAINAHEAAREEMLKAEARADLAQEIADAPRKGRKERIAELSPEQDEKLRVLIRRGDSLNDAYTTVEDAPEERLSDEARRRILAVLASERDKGWGEVHRYKEELGLEVRMSEDRQPERGAGERSGA